MMRYTVECVPNFSEGRDAGKVQSILAAVIAGPCVACLDIMMDADHNRSVVTLVGTPGGVAEAALRGIGCAAALLDLNQHSGLHPRIGAADVVPFVPLDGTALKTCVEIAEQVAEQAWTRYQIPTYLYEAAARRPARRNLESVRKGGFEGLRDEVRVNPERKPDFGDAALHPTAGATAVGARNFLIAYNINLNVPDAAIAQTIARQVRASNGGLEGVKAMGLLLPSKNMAQVSLNITDFKAAPLARVFAEVEKEAAALGAMVLESELIGLVPRAALDGAPIERMCIRDFSPGMILENRLARVT
ncbi:MAG TPA: glutamate formimidoyltransferase [Terriglobia bacterium]|nr:glutamate formimidoyltransferase [Terriglobia bacterium]